ncbi:MAG: hypothetical protein LC791_03300 [Acidobacteria bacterium]|nr:hypothetical protein [Acidobacteriota bacterium]
MLTSKTLGLVIGLSRTARALILPAAICLLPLPRLPPTASGVERAVGAGFSVSAQELIERTVAIVGDQVITLSDVRAAIALRLVETEAGLDPIDSATSRLIDRALMLREVQHYAPPEPPDAAVDQRVAFSRERFASTDAFRSAMEAGGFSDQRLRVWIGDDLRIAAYLDQRFAAAGMPNDQEVLAYYNEHRLDFEQGGVSFDAAVPLIRERLAGERRRELITDWLSDLRRRTEIVRISDLQVAD